MKFFKTIELDISNNEAYILENIANKIVINDMFTGLLVFNNNLELVHRIPFLPGTKIRTIYKKYSEDELLLYCYENSYLLHVNMRTYKLTMIPLDQALCHFYFTLIYYWDQFTNEVILTSQDTLYLLNLRDQTIKEYYQTEIRAEHHLFFTFWQRMRNFNLLACCPNKFLAIYQENNRIKSEVFDHLHTKDIIDEFSNGDVKTITYNRGAYILVRDLELEIVLPGNRIGIVKAEEPFVFDAARFLDTSLHSFIVLYFDTEKKNRDAIARYEIEIE